MKTYRCTEQPIHVYGVVEELLPGRFWRLPEALMGQVSQGVAERAIHPPGGRVRFRTDSARVTVEVRVKTNVVDWAIPLSGSAGADVYVGLGASTRYAGVAAPKNYEERSGVLVFEKQPVMEDITIHLMRNEELEDVIIQVEDGAVIEAPTPYASRHLLVFYGSSITEGGCASRPSNAYTALLSRWLDADYINLGFSAAAKGEPEMARYIASLERMSVFVMDYDHNAPTVEHLADTHEPFFQSIRQARPELPVLMLTRPDFDWEPESNSKRRDIVRRTYENAVAAGDKHVYMIDGETFFGSANRESCTIDGCHPSDVGFMRMAEIIYPVLKEIMAEAPVN